MNNLPSKPLEFWVTREFYATAEPKHFAYSREPKYGDKVWNNKAAYFHVIEYSTYKNAVTKGFALVKILEKELETERAKHERVLQMLEIATKALKQIAGPRKKDGSYFYSIPEIQKMGDDGTDTDNARYALEKIDKIESLK